MGEDLDFRTWEMLSAYLDGALDGIGKANVERLVRDDPEIASALIDLRRQKAALRRWAADLDVRPVPLNVRAMLDRARAERIHCTNDGGGSGETPRK